MSSKRTVKPPRGISRRSINERFVLLFVGATPHPSPLPEERGRGEAVLVEGYIFPRSNFVQLPIIVERCLQLPDKRINGGKFFQRSFREISVIGFYYGAITTLQSVRTRVVVVTDVNVIERPRRSTAVAGAVFKSALDV